MQPRKTFQNLSPEKQERITRIAVEEFGNKGFDGASINAMVDRMKIAKGSIFQYFGDKKGLFLFVFNRSVEMVKGYLRTVRDQSADDDLATRLNKTLTSGIHFIQKHPMLYRLYMKVLFEPKAPFRDEILISLRNHSIEYLRSLLENSQVKGELKQDIDLNKAAFILDAVMDRFLQAHAIPHPNSGMGIFEAPAEQTEDWISEITDMVCRGIAKSHFYETHASESPKEPYFLVLAAIEEELAGLIIKISNPEYSWVGTRKIISGFLEHVPVKLLTAGPGMVNTAQALTAVIETDRPQMIIQTGCAGVFRQCGLDIGDVAIATEEIDIQAGLEPLSGDLIPDELPFALVNRENTTDKAKPIKNRYPMNLKLADHAFRILQSASSSKNFNVGKGPFVTVSTITTTDDRANAMVKQFTPYMEQMEGSAAAHTAILYDIPFIEVRSASNFAGKRDLSAWNKKLAFQNACTAVIEVIRHLGPEIIRIGLPEKS